MGNRGRVDRLLILGTRSPSSCCALQRFQARFPGASDLSYCTITIYVYNKYCIEYDKVSANTASWFSKTSEFLSGHTVRRCGKKISPSFETLLYLISLCAAELFQMCQAAALVFFCHYFLGHRFSNSVLLMWQAWGALGWTKQKQDGSRKNSTPAQIQRQIHKNKCEEDFSWCQ